MTAQKARDIIAGWPRGRSTSYFRHWEFVDDWYMYLRYRSQTELIGRLKRDQAESAAYHERQSQMVDAWRQDGGFNNHGRTLPFGSVGDINFSLYHHIL